MIQFPAGAYDDGIDALEGVVSMVRAGYSGTHGVFLAGVESGLMF
jgi:hypothetical protein